MHSWGVSSVVMVFAVLAFVISLVLVLSVVVKKDCQLEEDRANTVRAQLLLLLAIGAILLVLVSQRLELADSIRHLMA